MKFEEVIEDFRDGYFIQRLGRSPIGLRENIYIELAHLVANDWESLKPLEQDEPIRNEYTRLAELEAKIEVLYKRYEALTKELFSRFENLHQKIDFIRVCK